MVCTSVRTKAVACSLGPWVTDVASVCTCFRKRFQLLNKVLGHQNYPKIRLQREW